MTPREIAERVTGGTPLRCYGWKAKIWNAAFEAAEVALSLVDRVVALRAAQGRHTAFVVELVTAERAGHVIECDEDQWRRLDEVGEVEKQARAALMPTEQDAIFLINDAYQRLKELGWDDPAHCPKDGSGFDVIEAGSTGIHKCFYEGKWPSGSWLIESDGDLWPSRPLLYRITDREIAERQERAARFAALAPPPEQT